MKNPTTIRRALALAAALLSTTIASPAHARVPEIPDPYLPDIAVVRLAPNGWGGMSPVIFYNPNTCAAMGPLVCNWFRAHEYGHVMLGHALGGTHPAAAEAQADCWAAQNASPQMNLAAIQHFANPYYTGDWSHGTGADRIARIRQCGGL